jgi:malate dehydrogenase (oxaloacetate-decarboxylating)
VTSASYSITVRLAADGDPASVGRIATAVGSAGGAVTAIDVVESRPDGLIVDVTCSAADAAHSEEVVAALDAVDNVHVRKVSDRTFLLHLGGKLEVASKVPLKTRDDLSMAYTPGVARVWPSTRRTSAGSPSRATPSPWSPTARPCWAWATSGPAPRCR